MSVFSDIATQIGEFESKLHADAGHLVDEFKALVARLTGAAEADVDALTAQAETVGAPLVAAAEADAAALASEAVAGVEQAVTPPTA
jgi:hypothetical protein